MKRKTVRACLDGKFLCGVLGAALDNRKGLDEMGGYPAEIIGAYRRGETTRAEFLSALGAWQRGRGRRFVRTAEAGTLDFEGYDNRGRFCAIECKRPVGGRLSAQQEARISDVNAKGGVAFVAHSGEEALRILREKSCI